MQTALQLLSILVENGGCKSKLMAELTPTSCVNLRQCTDITKSITVYYSSTLQYWHWSRVSRGVGWLCPLSKDLELGKQNYSMPSFSLEPKRYERLALILSCSFFRSLYFNISECFQHFTSAIGLFHYLFGKGKEKNSSLNSFRAKDPVGA